MSNTGLTLDSLLSAVTGEVQKRLSPEEGEALRIDAETIDAQLVGAPFDPRAVPADPVAGRIDHTLLKPAASADDVRALCREARAHNFATVCVNASMVAVAAAALEGTPVKPIAVVGFPLGATLPHAKAFETEAAVAAGAEEIDMVINVGALKGKDYQTVAEDLGLVVAAAGDVPVKAIIETSLLDRDEKVIACALAKAAGVAFVKTSTGFSGGGATVEDVQLMRAVVGEDTGVKASGGVRTRADFDAMVAAGADRIGASASVAIVTGGTDASDGY